MQIRRLHWMMALTAAGLVHAGIAAAVVWRSSDTGAVSAGVGGIEVSLGPAGGAPGRVASTAAVAPDAAVAKTTPQEAEATPEPETSETVDAVEAPTEAAPSKVLPSPPVELAEAKPIDIEEAPVPNQKPRPPEPASEASAYTAVSSAPPRTVEAVEPEAEQVAAIAPSAPGAGGKAGTQARPSAGSANDTSGGGIPGEAADFMAQLQAWLEKHKEYPRRARMRRQEGTALLYFVMDRDGQVLRHRLEQSSGHDVLDKEVMAMIERAQPLPRLPTTMNEPRLELVVPVQFILR